MRSRLTALTIVAVSLGAATITSVQGAAMAEAMVGAASEPAPGSAGGPMKEGSGLDLALGAGGAAEKASPDETSPDETSPDEASPDEREAPKVIESAAGACPEEMVLVQGEHCYTNEQRCLRWDDPEGRPERRVCAVFEARTSCKSRRHAMRFCMDRDEFVAPGQQLPSAGLSWEQARTTCQSLGKRLCTSLEWEFACEGEDGLPYPYGYERSPSLCNQDRVVRDGESEARGDLREPPHPSCVSPFGVRDMVGNVDEWVMRPYEKRPHRAELRGGWWMTGRNRCRAATTSHDERYADRQTGFRCCRDANGDAHESAR